LPKSWTAESSAQGTGLKNTLENRFEENFAEICRKLCGNIPTSSSAVPGLAELGLYLYMLPLLLLLPPSRRGKLRERMRAAAQLKVLRQSATISLSSQKLYNAAGFL
jgi:hypothetical protein